MNTEKTGKLIAKLRKEKHLTQAELADMLMVSDKAISRWETGRGFPDISNLESISETLGVTITELLNGEQLTEAITKDDIQAADTTLMTMVKSYVRTRNYRSALLGFLSGLLVLVVTVVHLTSPVYIKDYQDALTLDHLSDGRIVVATNSNVAGIEVEKVENPDTGQLQVFVSCYQTRWDQIEGKASERLIVVGGEEVDEIYYYPTDKEDQLIYSRNPSSGMDGGVVTLPRLIYNYWILLGITLSIAGLTVYWFCRRKRYARTLFRLILAPIAWTISIPLCLMGKFSQVYNAAFYLTGILLAGAVIYVIILSLYETGFRRKKS